MDNKKRVSLTIFIIIISAYMVSGYGIQDLSTEGIKITEAYLLDSDKRIISDVFDEVSARDGELSQKVYHGEYVRVNFEQALDSTKDIKVYAENPEQSDTYIELYLPGSETKLMAFPLIHSGSSYKIHLLSMDGLHDTFDLKVVNKDDDEDSYLKFDLIIDPTAEPGGAVELRAQSCNEIDGAGSSYDESCDGTYPAACNSDRLSCNDGTVEQQSTSSGGWTGVKIETYNSAVSDCSSISTVNLCYEHWNSGQPFSAGDESCEIRVDNDGDDSWVSISSTCPGTTANPGVTCTDVSSDEAWDCSNFFGSSGTRATAATYISSGSHMPTHNEDALYFSVDYSTSGGGSSGVPEFSTMTMMLSMILVCSGMFVMRKRYL